MSAFTAPTSTTIPPYPELTPGFDNKQGTYWPNLSTSSKTALDQLTKLIIDKNIDLHDVNIEFIDSKLILLRFLRANNFDVKKALAHIEKNITWRRDMKVKELVEKTPESILGIELKELTKVFPHWHHGYDRTGRPVVYKQYGKFDASHVKKLAGGNYDRVVQYHVWEQEACLRLCLKQTAKTGKLVETVTGIVDVKDMGLFQITRDFLALTKLLADVDQGQYPETLGRIYIINVPSAFPMVWRMVKPWLDPIVTSKIFIFGSPKDYEPVLIDFIGKENLPSNYGGDLPPLNCNVHPYEESMKEYATVGLTEDFPTSIKRSESEADTTVVTEGELGDEASVDPEAVTFAQGL